MKKQYRIINKGKGVLGITKDNLQEVGNEAVLSPSLYLGTFATLNALNTAHPTPANGTYAFSTDRTTRWNRIEGQWQIESLGNAESAPQELYQNINELINAQATQSGDTLYYVGDATQDPAVVARGTTDAYYIYSGQANGVLSDYMLQPTDAFAPVVLDAGQNITIVNDVVDVKIPPFEIVSAILGTTGLFPQNLTIDSLGNIYTTNFDANNVTKITPAGVSSILGTTGSRPTGIAIDLQGNIYTANQFSNNVTKITPAGVSTILATTGSQPRSIAIDLQGNIYTANSVSNNVTKITPAGVSTILGTTATSPFDIVIDSSGNIYTANASSNNVTKITPAGVSTILGTTGSSPYGIAIDSQSNIYTANADSENVTKITPAGVSTILGTTGLFPYGIAIDLQGNIYTANADSDNVTKITPAGVSTILGTTGSQPFNIAIDSQNNIYTVNAGSNNVTKIGKDTRRNLAINDAGNIVRTDLPEEIDTFPTTYTPTGTVTDRLVNYGNGTNNNNRSDAYTLFKNGMQKFFTAALSTITNAVKGSVVLDENARLHIHDGTAFKEVAFSDEVKSLKNDIVKGASYFNDFDGNIINSLNDGNFIYTGVNGGTISQTLDAAFDEDDVLSLRCSSAINSAAYFHNSNGTTVSFKNVEHRAKVRVKDLATAADKFLFMFGRANNPTIMSSFSCYGFIYDKAGDYLGTASDNWLAVTRNFGDSTIVDTGIPVIDSVYVRLMIRFTPTSIAYFFNGVLVATITTNIVLGFSRDLMAIQKTAAGTISQEVLVDYYARTQTKITPRIYDN